MVGVSGPVETGMVTVPKLPVPNPIDQLKNEIGALANGASGGVTEKGVLKEITEELKKPGVNSTDLTKKLWDWSQDDVDHVLEQIHANGGLPSKVSKPVTDQAAEEQVGISQQPQQVKQEQKPLGLLKTVGKFTGIGALATMIITMFKGLKEQFFGKKGTEGPFAV